MSNNESPIVEWAYLDEVNGWVSPAFPSRPKDASGLIVVTREITPWVEAS
jgi:hypothetical protein